MVRSIVGVFGIVVCALLVGCGSSESSASGAVTPGDPSNDSREIIGSQGGASFGGRASTGGSFAGPGLPSGSAGFYSGSGGTSAGQVPIAPPPIVGVADAGAAVLPVEPAVVNPFTVVAHDPLSTFAADVDTASYDLFVRDIGYGHLPIPSTVR